MANGEVARSEEEQRAVLQRREDLVHYRQMLNRVHGHLAVLSREAGEDLEREDWGLKMAEQFAAEFDENWRHKVDDERKQIRALIIEYREAFAMCSKKEDVHELILRISTKHGFHWPDAERGIYESVTEGSFWADRPLEASHVRAPLLVRKREVVTVVARHGGVRVRTMARARDDGSLGDIVAVESLADRQSYFARVSGVRQVEIYAQSAQASRPMPLVANRYATH